MCAISGIISRNGDLTFSNETIHKMLDSQKHRGPDHSNFFFNKKVLLLHNRLSIIDIDKRSNQPFISNCKNYVLVFNGEIYNYIEIKKKLSNFYDFKTKSDTEVIIAAYKKWGINFLNELYGAFAFCIYDLKKKQAFFARDRFGQKPIFFWKNNNNLYFSSEIKYFIVAGYKPEPNYDIWNSYLSDGDTDNFRNTFFKNIFQLLPGEFLEITDSNLKINNWYKLIDKVDSRPNTGKISVIKNELFEILNESVKLNCRSDAKISISLSGGLDSNTLVAISKRNNLHGDIPKCFSVLFENFTTEKKLIEKNEKFHLIKTNFINFFKKDLLKEMKDLVKITESPTGGLMNCALNKLYKHVSDGNIKVILDGTGLDEILGGYEVSHLLFLNELKNLNIEKYNYNLKLFSNFYKISITSVEKKIKNLKKNTFHSIDGYQLAKPIISSDFQKKNLDFLKQKKINLNFHKHLVDLVQYSKIPRNNRLKDRASMSNSLELRLPFLEHKLIEYCLNLPKDVYFTEGRSKSILRESMKGLMENKVRLSPKISQQSPQNRWLREEPFKTYFNDLINSKKFKERGIFDVKNLENAWGEFLSKQSETSFFIWQVSSTEQWFETFIDK